MVEARCRVEWDHTALLAALSFRGTGKVKDFHPCMRHRAAKPVKRDPAQDFELIGQLLSGKLPNAEKKK